MAKALPALEQWDALSASQKKGVEKTLRDAFNLDPKEKETRQKFLFRLMMAGKTCPEEEWEKLGDPAQKWVNAAIDADNHKEDLPDPKGAPPEEDRGSSSRNSKDEQKEKDDMAAKKTTTRGKAGGDKGGKGGGGGAKSSAPVKKPGAKSARRQLKEVVIKKPSTSLEALEKQFGGGKDGLSKLTIGSIRSDTLNTLKVADDLGFWKGPALTKD